MGQPVPLALGVRSNPGKNRQVGTAELTNCRSEQTGEDAKAPWTIFGTAGLSIFATALGGTIRAMLPVNNILYVVAGRNVCIVTPGGVVTRIGGIQSDGAVYMERNRRVPPQIGIVSGGFYYVIDTGTNSMTQILDPDLPGPIALSFLEGYGVLPIPGGAYMLTALDDFSAIDGLDRGTAEAFPDDLVRSMVLESELVLFGETSTEWHVDSGGADFPFTRVHATELGCLAPDSVAKVDGPTNKTLIWVAPDHTVRQMSGYTAQVVSTPEISDLIKELHEAGEISTLKGFAWADSGSAFYALRCDRWCRVLDTNTGHWHTRKSYLSDTWRVSSVVQFGDKLIAGDRDDTGTLYVMGGSYNMEGAHFLPMQIDTPLVHAFPYRLKFNTFYLDAASGVGLNTSDPHASDPKVLVSWTDDAVSYSAERERSLGRLGQVAKRIPPIHRLGTTGSRGRSFRIRISAPIERIILGASIDFEKLGA